MKKYDAIVIGAGIAGITFSYLMKKANKKVLIVEKEKISNKNKLCGGLLTKKSYNLLCIIFNIDNKKLNIKKNELCVVHNNNNTLNIKLNLFSVYRKELDSYLLNEYLKLGGELIDETQYTNLDLENSTIEINHQRYQYHYLVGADGVFSQLRKEITGRNQRKNFALEIAHNQISNSLEIYFFNHFKGYGWIIPNCQNSMIGIGEVSEKIKIKDTFVSYLEKMNIKEYHTKGAFLPTGNDIYLSYKNVFFIGDSAGLISPITGEGIYYALISAKILSENLNNNYSARMKKIVKQIKKQHVYLKYVYNDKIRNYLFSRYHNVFIRRIINKFADRIL